MEGIVQTIERLLIKPENEVLELKEAKESFDIPRSAKKVVFANPYK